MWIISYCFGGNGKILNVKYLVNDKIMSYSNIGIFNSKSIRPIIVYTIQAFYDLVAKLKVKKSCFILYCFMINDFIENNMLYNIKKLQ